MTQPQAPNLSGKPIALALAKIYGYEMPYKHCKYHINAAGRTCLDVTGLPITDYLPEQVYAQN